MCSTNVDVETPDFQAGRASRPKGGGSAAGCVSAAYPEVVAIRRGCGRARLLGLFLAGYLVILGMALLTM